jgi:steroid Delta-isomerase
VAPSPDAAPVQDGHEGRQEFLVRRYYEMVDAKDVAGLIRLFAPDATYHRPGYPCLVGRAELEQFYRDQRIILEGSHTLTKIVVCERDVAVHGEFAGLLRDGRQVRLRFADFFSLTPDGLFENRETFFFTPLV